MNNENVPVDQTGYVIVPLVSMSDKDIETVKNSYPDCIISQRELTAMYNSAVKEINNGDNGKKSLNVKLYNCIAHYVHTGLDELTNRTFRKLI